ncbi:MAG TPA: MSHA biogenesis protein MshK [Noviherbaspirillum sp.]|uniref:MSHA biogenesis protein MshK n=1 Tax=Noviherbaspirillum sp. TaxID=1926288 RepID=UPI002D64AD08|nr:MSHA biogenesis protein MshK [Noviherbaspirillum sp.]HYD96058.1 MSHA biogenesis protein MshK [Noviherbaspirillum sp.]
MVKPVTALKTVRITLAASVGILSLAAFAQGLKDPTRPPVIAAAPAPGGTAVDAAATAPVLQSVVIAPGRVVAIISGQTVKLNDQFGSARVIKISETEVVLRDGKELRTLNLFPNIHKKASNDKPDGKAGNRMQ